MLPRGCYHFSLRAPRSSGLLVALALLWLHPAWRIFPLHRPNATPSPATLPLSFGPQESPPPQAIPPATVNPPVLKRSPIRLARLGKSYRCAGDVQLTVLQENGAVRLTLNKQIYELTLQSSDGGARKYSAGAISWSVAGDAGILQDAADPAHPVVLAGDCRQISLLPPLVSSSLHGTLNLPPGKDLPANSKIHIQLLDVTSPVLPHESLAEETFDLSGGQAPISFELAFNPKRISSPECCAVSAEVFAGGRAIYTTGHPRRIPNLADAGSVSLQLQPVRPKPVQP